MTFNPRDGEMPTGDWRLKKVDTFKFNVAMTAFVLEGSPFGTSLKTVSILQEVECTSCNEDRCLQRSEYVPCRPVGVPAMGDDVTRRRRLE